MLFFFLPLSDAVTVAALSAEAEAEGEVTTVFCCCACRISVLVPARILNKIYSIPLTCGNF